MASIAELLEAYKNYQGVQQWKLGQQMNRVPGAEEAMDLWGGWDTGGLAGAIKTYHMTPHEFDTFDLTKAKSGLGGMMHGRGVYTVDNPQHAADWAEQLSPTLQKKAKVLDVNLRWPDPVKEAATPMSPEDYLHYQNSIKDLPQEIQDIIVSELESNPQGLAKLLKKWKAGNIEDIKQYPIGPIINYMGLEQGLASKGIPGMRLPFDSTDYITFDPKYTQINK